MKNKKENKGMSSAILFFIAFVLIVAVFVLPNIDPMFAQSFGMSLITAIICLSPIMLIVMLVLFFGNNI